MTRKLLFASSLLFSSLTWAEQWHALVIGANNYAHYEQLGGAINDAHAIAAALKSQGVKPTVLIDQEAKYDTIKNWWEKTISEVGENDKIFFSVAGHGAREKEHFSGTEAKNAQLVGEVSNNLDEVIVLPNYHDKGKNSRERIVDQELLGWMQAATAKGATVFAVADVCYGGGQTRSASSGRDYGDQIAKVRNAGNDILEPEDQTKRGTAKSAELKVRDTSAFNDRLFYAVPYQDENLKVTEAMLNNKPHGVLSYVIAQIIAGKAVNEDGEAVHTAKDIRKYLPQISKSLTVGTQSAELEGVSRSNQNAFLLPQKNSNVQPVVNTNKPKLPTLFVAQGCQTNGNKKFFTLENNPDKATFRWDCQAGTVVQYGVGEIAYDVRNDTDLRSFLQQQSLLAEIRALTLPTFAGGIFPASQQDLSQNKVQIFEKDDQVAIYFAKPAGDVLFALNLPSKDGVQFLNTIKLHSQSSLGYVTDEKFDALLGRFPVVAPFGSDHLLLIAMKESTAQNLRFFRDLLKKKPKIDDGRSAANEMILDLKTLSAKEASLSIVPFATTPR